MPLIAKFPYLNNSTYAFPTSHTLSPPHIYICTCPNQYYLVVASACASYTGPVQKTGTSRDTNPPNIEFMKFIKTVFSLVNTPYSPLFHIFCLLQTSWLTVSSSSVEWPNSILAPAQTRANASPSFTHASHRKVCAGVTRPRQRNAPALELSIDIQH